MATLNPTAQQDVHSGPPVLEKALQRLYTLDFITIAYVIIFAVAVISRFWDVGARVMSHDESLHTYYSWKLYDSGDFQHTPLMHGPVIFHMVAFFYWLFGPSDFSARIYPAVLGVLLVMFPILFQRWIGKTGAVITSIGLLISPMILFHSRYIREDIPSIFFTMVMFYGMLQYIDGVKPRRPVWLAVLAGGMLLSLASKEVAFMYIAIFGSFFTLYWVMRIIQDLNFQRQIAPDEISEPDLEVEDQPVKVVKSDPTPFWQLIFGHLVALGFAGVLGYLAGHLLGLFTEAQQPGNIPLGPLGFTQGRFYSLIFIGIFFVLTELLGPVRAILGSSENKPATNVGQMVVNLLGDARSTVMLITAGLVIGGVCGLWAFSILDVIKPETVFEEVTLSQRIQQQAANDPNILNTLPGPGQKIEAIDVQVNRTELGHAATWLLVPMGIICFLTIIIAALKTPTALRFTMGDASVIIGGVVLNVVVLFLNVAGPDLGLPKAALWILLPIDLMVVAFLLRPPWEDVLIIFLVAAIIFGVLVVAERRSLKTEEGQQQSQFAADPNATNAQQDTHHENKWIWASWLMGTVIAAGVLLTRMFTNWWDFFNRQPVFDVLIVIGTLAFPWLAAFPLFWAGYKLDAAPLPDETFKAAILVVIPFFLVSASVGLAWNYRLWPIPLAVFALLFVVFFTTFFTNGNGVGTGLIGSLGYWLEQQGVRRGSQPQYYYTFLEIPVYEFLPTIIASIAGFAGLSSLFEFRQKARRYARETTNRSQSVIAEANALTPEQSRSIYNMIGSEGQTLTSIPTELIEMAERNRSSAETQVSSPTYMSFDPVAANVNPDTGGNGATLPDEKDWEVEYGDNGNYSLPNWARPYDHDEEITKRNDPTYLGSFPFLQFMGYWGVMIIVALTMAGEKMPWLTTHISVPLIFVGGAYLGTVVEKIRWSSLKASGWVLLTLVVPVFLIALEQLLMPALTGGPNLPFQGRSQIELEATGQWMAALIGVIITGYFIVQLAIYTGFEQARKLIFISATILLALLTARVAWLAAYINYDYPTEFMVYAHSGPAVKTVMDDIYYMAARSPEGMNMRIVYDDESSWPFTWYLRDFHNYGFIVGEASNVSSNPSQLDGAKVVIVGNKKNAEVEKILGKDYYRFNYIRLWWPMQAYFNLDYTRIANLFESDASNPAASHYRRAIWDIWWSRDYKGYGQAECIERDMRQCLVEGTEDTYDQSCIQRVTNDCSADSRYNVENWPVSDALYVYVRKDFVATIWDSGLDGQSVTERLVPDPENVVQREVVPSAAFGQNEITEPRDLDVDAQGNLVVADNKNRRIAIFSPDGTFLREMGTGELNELWGVAVSPVNGNIYAADTWNHRIVVFSPDGELLSTFGRNGVIADGTDSLEGFYGPRDVAVDKDGLIYVADTGNHRIRVYDQTWTHIRDIGSRGTSIGQLQEPVGIAIHPISGELYVAETWNQRVSVFKRDGTYVRSWDVNMWEGTQFSPNRPYLTISLDGTLIFVGDMDSSGGNSGPRVVGYDLSGQAMIALNGGLAVDANNLDQTGNIAGVSIVGGLAFGQDGRLFVADAGTSRIVVFPPTGITGNLAPVQDPSYGSASTGGSETTQGETFLTTADMEFLDAFGLSYWRILSTGDYDGYKTLFCQEVQNYIPNRDTFLNTIAKDYLGTDVNQVVPLPQIEEGQVVIRWSGYIVRGVGSGNEQVETVNTAVPIQMERNGAGWYICPEQPVFRPGGG
ncbi:MAG: TIGR03663 family protein [Chloroflexi bacterium]|nr:TIGR03663 family protein [Chloroflexota bacterium]